MNKELSEILVGFRRVLSLLEQSERATLLLASLVMLIAGVLTNIPALILGRLVDRLVDAPQIEFSSAAPYIGFIIAVILAREVLKVKGVIKSNEEFTKTIEDFEAQF